MRFIDTLMLAVVAFGVANLANSSAEAAQPGRLSGASIQELVTGATVNMHTPVGTIVPVKYAEDGTVTGTTSGVVAYYLGASKDRGRWWIKGRRLCQQWKVWFSGKPKCIEIRRQGQKFHWKDLDGKTGVATLVRPANAKIAKRKTSKPLGKPYSLGTAPADVAALPTVTQPALVKRRAKPRKTTASRRKVAVAKTRRAARKPVALRSPPLPVRPAVRQAFVKTSSWTMRAQ